VIVWVNGAFGAGKTTTAAKLVGLLPAARLFDPEQVGYLLRHVLYEPVDDFQDLPPWRGLVRETARRILDHAGGTLVAPQTILVERYAREVLGGLTADGVPVHHVVLHTGRDELVRRIEHDSADPGARRWRLDHVEAYFAAVPWLHAAGTVVDTTGRAPDEVAHAIVGHLP
jgi:hypothetical protein